MNPAWKDYQEQAAAFFRSLGLEAETDVTVTGARTTHDVDVIVKSKHVGFEIMWLVECKFWQTPVSKLHVLALREIVHDVGADRGIILSESGFQSGAFEAAELTNVQLSSLAKLEISSQQDIYVVRLRELFNRIEDCTEIYWDIPKEIRIEAGLRPDISGYSGRMVIDFMKELISRAFRRHFPLFVDYPVRFLGSAVLTAQPEGQLKSYKDVFDLLEPMIVELETKLAPFRS